MKKDKFENNSTPDEQLRTLKLLPTPLPPQFLEIAAYAAGKRFLGLWYHATQSNLSDGQVTRPVSLYRVYAPLVKHMAVSIYVREAGADLGSDDSFPTHALLLDTENERIYLGTLETIETILRAQNERAAPASELFESFNSAKTLEEFQKLGMFEFFGSGKLSPEEARLQAEMKSFLDAYIPPKLIEIVEKYGHIF